MKNELIKIYDHFGQETQMKKLLEEANELVEAVKSGDVEHIAEEIADCIVVLEQIRLKSFISQVEIDYHMANKVSRTLDRIENGYYESEVK